MKAYSEDLRERVIRTVEMDRAREEGAARFEVSVPTIERWVRLKRETGGLARRRAEVLGNFWVDVVRALPGLFLTG